MCELAWVPSGGVLCENSKHSSLLCHSSTPTPSIKFSILQPEAEQGWDFRLKHRTSFTGFIVKIY